MVYGASEEVRQLLPAVHVPALEHSDGPGANELLQPGGRPGAITPSKFSLNETQQGDIGGDAGVGDGVGGPGVGVGGFGTTGHVGVGVGVQLAHGVIDGVGVGVGEGVWSPYVMQSLVPVK